MSKKVVTKSIKDQEELSPNRKEILDLILKNIIASNYLIDGKNNINYRLIFDTWLSLQDRKYQIDDFLFVTKLLKLSEWQQLFNFSDNYSTLESRKASLATFRCIVEEIVEDKM